MKLWQRLEATPASVRNSHLLGIGLMGVTAFMWAALEFFATAIPSRYFPFQIVWMRYGTHLLFMFLLLGGSEGTRLVRTPRPALHIFRSLLMFGMPVGFIAAVHAGAHPGFVWLLTWASIPAAIVVGAVMLREPVSLRWLVATCGALVGVWLVIRPPLPGSHTALVLSAVASSCLGFYFVFTRSLRTEPLSTNLFQTALWVFVVISLVMPFFWHPMSLRVIAAMIAVGLWGFVILLLLDRALACAPAALVAPFLFTECIWTAVLHATRGGAHFSMSQFAGAGILLLVCAGLGWREFRRHDGKRADDSLAKQTAVS